MNAATATLHHEREIGQDGESCIPRVALDCTACGERTVYCHVGRLTLARYLAARDAEGNSTWRCPPCRGATP